MEELLEDFVTTEDLKKFEATYQKHVSEGTLTPKHEFEYAWCLIRSRYPADIRRGVMLLEDLFSRGDETARRDYLFYLAVGNTKLKKYESALKILSKFLSVEPANRQALDLQKHIKEKMRKEGLLGMAMVGGAAVALGGLVGLGIAIAKSAKK